MIINSEQSEARPISVQRKLLTLSPERIMNLKIQRSVIAAETFECSWRLKGQRYVFRKKGRIDGQGAIGNGGMQSVT